MTSTTVSNLAQAQGSPVLLSKTAKVWTAVIGLLMVAYHWHFLTYTYRLGMSDADWSHVLIIPLISIYYIYLHRQTLMATPRRICPAGIGLIYFGLIGYSIGSLLLSNPMAMGYSLITTVFGICLLLLGPAMMRTLWFPILFLVFGVKVSDAIWSQVAAQMQEFAATGATALINIASPLTDMEADLKGSTIHLEYIFNGKLAAEPMNVAEACAGMRMLMAFLALGVALAFLFPRRWWQRLIMLALAAPIAIFVNALRIAILGWLHLIDKELAHGDFHLFIGMLTLIPAAGLLMLVGWCLDKIIITEGKAPPPPAPLPFEEDPDRVNIEPKPAAKGVGIGAAAMLVFAGLEILALVYVLPAIGVSTVVEGTFTKRSALIQLAMHSALAVGLWLVVRAFFAKPRLATVAGAVCAMMFASFVGQAAVIQFTGIHLFKDPLKLQHTFTLEFPKQAGDWEQVHHDPPLPKDQAAELGTDQYFNRYYINTASGVTAADLEKAVSKSKSEQGYLALRPFTEDPGDFARVHATYYTGMLDSVPHVPDKCWVVGGSKPLSRDVYILRLSRPDYTPEPQAPDQTQAASGVDQTLHVLANSTGFDKQVRIPTKRIITDDLLGTVAIEVPVIIFSGADADGNISTALYFFVANGRTIASSHEVRFSFNLKDRYSYYSKVEVMFPGLTDPDAVAEKAEVLLSDILPEVMACLPDWTEVQAGRWGEDGPIAGEAQEAQ